MRPRSALLLATSAALVLGGLSAQGSAVARPPADAGTRPDPHLVDARGADGRPEFLGSTDGRVLRAGTPGLDRSQAARAHLTAVAPGLGIAAPGRDLVSRPVLPVPGGGSVARYDQQIDGIPVFGGQVVLSMTAANGLTSVLAHVSAASSVAPASVPQRDAERTAVEATAKAEGVRIASLQAGSSQLVVFDPSIVDTTAVGPARPAWQVDVAGGPAIDELVLVDAQSGGVILRFNQVDTVLDRRVCDNVEVPQSPNADPAPCTATSGNLARTEGQPETGNANVDTAYRLLGETSSAFAEITGSGGGPPVDLSSFIGVDTGGTSELRATVDWCYSGTYGCPYQNAFWSGTQMYFGQGYEVADDVVAHELTHGVTDHTSGLFYFAQSGAMNESFSDVFGEIVDRRFQQPGEAPDVWLIGEDLPHRSNRANGAIRNMADPGQFGDPAKMTSKRYVSSGDNDGVHTDSGVGNKTFYLISQGGTFNGVSLTGIDGSDPTLAKSALLYYDTLVSLTSGSEYADLGLMLQQQCADLAATGTLGFTSDDCTQVSRAVTATELAKSPRGQAAQPKDPPPGCPAGTVEEMLFDGESSPAGLAPGDRWIRAPGTYSDAPTGYSYDVPSNETSAGGSWFAFDAPYAGSSSLEGTVGVSLPAGQTSYLRFSQWRLYDFYGSTYFDGGTVSLKQQGSTGFHTVSLAKNQWVNGPQQLLYATGGKGFGGDSHGWVTSRVDLTPQAGTVVEPVFTTHSDRSIGYDGWYLDDIQIYSCRPVVPPSEVTGFSAAVGATTGRADVTLSWAQPGDLGEGLTGFELGGAGGSHTLAADATTFTFPGLRTTKSYDLWVRPVGLSGALGPRTRFSVAAVEVRVALSYPRVKPSQLPRISGRLLSGDVAGRDFEIQYRRVGSRSWKPLAWPGGGPAIVRSTDQKGRFWATYDRPRRAIEIRVHFEAGSNGFAGYSPVVTQRLD